LGIILTISIISIKIYKRKYAGVKVKMKRETSDMMRELASCESFTAFYSENNQSLIKHELCDYLAELTELHGIKKSDAIRRAQLNDSYAYQIFSGRRIPERNKLLALAVGMELSLDEVQNLLRVGGYAPLYVKLEFDCIVIFGICKNMTVADINDILYDHGLETLG